MKKNLEKKTIRQPVQERSINRREKILDAALELFCEVGYYKTTTNEIAKKAQVSIGSLYSYFADKDTIFIEVLDRYHHKFELAKNGPLSNTTLLIQDSRYWLRELLLNLIRVHEETKELNRELRILSFHNPKIEEILERNKEKTMKDTIGFFVQFSKGLKISDPEASIVVAFDLLSSTVDRIVFEKNEIDRERLINAAIDAVNKYFFCE